MSNQWSYVHKLTCQWCKGPFEASRSDAKTCSDTCRSSRARHNKAIKSSTAAIAAWSDERAEALRQVETVSPNIRPELIELHADKGNYVVAEMIEFAARMLKLAMEKQS